LIARLSALIALVLASCAAAPPFAALAARFEPAQDIRYVSGDLRNVLVFSREGARFGDRTALAPGLWPSYPAEIIPTNDRVECISIGPPGSDVQLAIRRPLRAGDRYRCLRTSFHVARCFADCRAAVVEIEQRPASGVRGGPFLSSMYVDSCRGLLVYGDVGNLAEGIPLGALWLRDNVGLFADPHYPHCSSFELE